jgi:general secretion pathway protein E
MSEALSIQALTQPSAEAMALVPPRIAARYGVLPLRLQGNTLHVAMEDPGAFDILDELSMALGCPVVGEAADPRRLADAIREHYGVGAETLDSLRSNQGAGTAEADATIDDLSEDASIIKFVNQIIVDAYNSRATDIHLEPFEHRLRVRYRIDGILVDARIPESIRHFRDAIVSRIKIMADLDIAERRLPQDGRIRVRITGKEFDLRVSVIPIAHGQSVNIRILQRSNVLLGLDSIGYDPEAIKTIHGLIKKPHGIILLTGPTGSGKTTTLYAALDVLNTSERKILTIEDPVEYQLEGICQMQVRSDIGFTFAKGLRSMLRHDPDVMLIGEIRDFETAELAIRCSLTGHLVFSTLHTNDAAGAAARLIDIGIEPYLLASSLDAVLAQRLIRLICPHCMEGYVPEDEALRECGADPHAVAEVAFKRGQGCERCRDLGYQGRSAIYELLLVDETIRGMIIDRVQSSRIKEDARRQGMLTLRDCGWSRVVAGLTTVDEVLRVTQDDAKGKGG